MSYRYSVTIARRHPETKQRVAVAAAPYTSLEPVQRDGLLDLDDGLHCQVDRVMLDDSTRRGHLDVDEVERG